MGNQIRGVESFIAPWVCVWYVSSVCQFHSYWLCVGVDDGGDYQYWYQVLIYNWFANSTTLPIYQRGGGGGSFLGTQMHVCSVWTVPFSYNPVNRVPVLCTVWTVQIWLTGWLTWSFWPAGHARPCGARGLHGAHPGARARQAEQHHHHVSSPAPGHAAVTCP